VVIPRSALEAVKNSLLAKLADDTWKADAAAGSTAENPIVTRPVESPCKEDWEPALANMIVDAYRWHQEKKTWDSTKEHAAKNDGGGAEANKDTLEPPRLKLPNDIELEDALIVLDYYGLLENEGPIDFDFNETRDDVHIRALLFLKWMKKAEEAKRFIIESLKKDPKVVTHFLFASSKHNMNYINDKMTNEQETFVRVGGEECDAHFEWIGNQRLRAGLVSWVEEESGLKAAFMNKNYYDGDVYGARPRPEESLLAVSADEMFQWDGMESMYVLRVVVPKATKRKRTE